MHRISVQDLIDNVLDYLNSHIDEDKRAMNIAVPRGAKWILAVDPDGAAGFCIDTPVWDKTNNRQALCFVESLDTIKLWAHDLLNSEKNVKRTVAQLAPDLKIERHGFPYDNACVTCGRENPNVFMRSNGKFYCTECWQAWNS